MTTITQCVLINDTLFIFVNQVHGSYHEITLWISEGHVHPWSVGINFGMHMPAKQWNFEAFYGTIYTMPRT